MVLSVTDALRVPQGVTRFEEAMEEEGMRGRKWVIPNRGNDDALHFYVYVPSR
jgi:hypothetical protein